jgi:peptidoglycan lytic transglycosylase
MNRALLLATVLAFFATGALAQGPCTQGVRIVSAWYAEGKHTASGQRFNPQGLTAAHRTFPFGTRLLVVNPHNGKSVTVTINDRGPFVKGIGLDLSLGAAKVIGLTGTGAVCMAKVGVAG